MGKLVIVAVIIVIGIAIVKKTAKLALWVAIVVVALWVYGYFSGSLPSSLL